MALRTALIAILFLRRHTRLVIETLQNPSSSRPSARRSDLLDSLEKGFRDASTAGVMLHQTVAERLGLHITDHKCMGMLCELGPLSAGSLAELTGLTTGAITSVLNRLERHGYARRVRNPKDKRNINVEALNVVEFNERMKGLFGPLRKRMRALSSKYSTEEMALIDGFIKSAVAISRSETARLRSELTRHVP
jgi:predicted transcriptional regulator